MSQMFWVSFSLPHDSLRTLIERASCKEGESRSLKFTFITCDCFFHSLVQRSNKLQLNSDSYQQRVRDEEREREINRGKDNQCLQDSRLLFIGITQIMLFIEVINKCLRHLREFSECLRLEKIKNSENVAGES